ncbi:hypothetical protein Mh1950_13760 [Mannheimia haemolytica]
MGQQSFSIYLLKENFNESNSIKGKYKHQLIKLSEKEWDNQELPDASLYLQVNEPKPIPRLCFIYSHFSTRTISLFCYHFWPYLPRIT